MVKLNAPKMVTAYRTWLLAEAVTEAQSGCARLRRVRDVLPAYFLEQTAGWAAHDVATLLQARIKAMPWMHARPVTLTLDEKRLLNAIEWPVLSPDAVARTEVVWELRQRYTRGEFRIDRSALRREVKSRMQHALGKATVVGGCARYFTKLDSVVVYTDVDYPTKGTGQMRYEQCIVSNVEAGRVVGYADPEVLLRASLFDLLGFHQTQWTCLTEGNIPDAVETLVDLCVGFIDEVPKLIQAATDPRTANRDL